MAVIDADLQDPVELIPEMFGKWREGYSVVYGVRRNRQEGLPKVLAYSIFYRLLSRISAIEFPKDSGDFCLLDRSAVDAINRLPEKNRFVGGFAPGTAAGRSAFPMIVRRGPLDVTRYSFAKLMNLAFDGIFSFSVLPLRFIFWLGLGSSIVGDVRTLVFFLRIGFSAFKIFGHSPADVPDSPA